AAANGERVRCAEHRPRERASLPGDHAQRVSADHGLRAAVDIADNGTANGGPAAIAAADTADNGTPHRGPAALASAGDPHSPPPCFPRVGGVMLHGAAAPATAGAQLTSGNFSLIFEGSHGEVDVPTLRRFVTALWATYFTQDGPGISIDPIAGIEGPHAVRYI